MDYKTLSLMLAEPDQDGPALDAAIDLAGRLGAHLNIIALGIDATMTDPVIAGGVPIVVEAGRSDARERSDAVLAWAKDRVPADFGAYDAEPAIVPLAGLDQMIAHVGRFGDLIVASRPYGPTAAPIHATIFEAALFRSGAPILMVPAAGLPSGFAQGGPVVVGWDDGDEALAAIRAALPLLTRASAAHIAMIDPPRHAAERADPGGPLCLMLARHGARAELSILARTLPTVAETLLRFATDREAVALVIGGYRHSRLRERMFGGVTRDLLERAPLPVLIAR